MSQSTENGLDRPTPTTGGVNIGNDVNVQNGDFVGRDQNISGDLVYRDKVVHVYTSSSNTLETHTIQGSIEANAKLNSKQFLAIFFDSIWNNRWLFGAVLLFESLFLGLFFQYRNRFMLPNWSFVIAAVLLFLTLQICDKVIRTRFSKLKWYLPIAIVFTSAWIALLSQQIHAAIFPPRIEPEKFGIAIATLYDGNVFFVSQESRQITDSLENALNFALQNEDLSPNDIGIKRIGIVRTNEEALEEGKRVGAELILWGEISEQPAYTTVFLQLLETSLLTENPDFPRTLPLNPQISLRIPIKTANAQDVVEILKPQNLGLANFSLGMFLYEHNQAPGQAAKKFEIAKNQFEQFKRNSEKTQSAVGVAPVFDETAKLNLGLVYYYLAKSYQLQGKYSQSQATLQEAVNYIPRDLAVWLGMMYNLRAMGNVAEFQKMAQCVINMAEQINEAKVLSEFCPILTGGEENESFGKNTINVSTANRFNQALAYEALNQYEQALNLYESILQPGQEPDFFIAHLSAASVLIKLNRLPDAKLVYDQAKSLVNGNLAREIALHMGLADWYESQDKWDSALLEYTEASRLNPELPMPYLGQARIYEEQNLDTLAEQSYDNYIQQAEKANYNLGNAYHAFARYLYRQQSYEKAIVYYNKALFFVHDKAVVYAHIGQAYSELNERGKALQAFSEAIRELEHNRSYVHDLYGRALITFGCIDEAIAQFEQAIQDSDDTLATTITKLNLAQQYQTLGDKEKARQLYEAIERIDPNPISQEHQPSFRELQRTAQTQLMVLDSMTITEPLVDRPFAMCVDDSLRPATR